MRVSKLIKPRIIVLVTTRVGDESNVATFSFVTPVSFNPKMLTFSVSPERYTHELLKKSKECVVNVVTPSMEELMWYCGSKSGKNVNKFEEKSIETEESEEVKSLRIKESPVQLECTVKKFVKAGDHELLICEVVKEHVKEEDYKSLLHVSGREVKIV